MAQKLARWLAVAAAWAVLVAAGAPGETTLPEPEATRALAMAVRGVAAVAADKGRLVLLAQHEPVALAVDFDPAAKARAKAFGALTDQRKTLLGPLGGAGNWSGIAILADRLLFLDGVNLALIEAEPATLKALANHTLPWDLLKPPPDRSGEPTRVETASLRAAFKRRYLATPGRRITGMAPVPAEWHAGKGRQYLLATRIEDFPLLLMECSADEPAACAVTRQCYLEGAGIKASAVTGIAVSAARRLVLIGDGDHQRLVGFQYQSCYHLPRRLSLSLPAKLKRLTNLTVDQDDRLWVSTETADDYLNAAVFAWDAKTW